MNKYVYADNAATTQLDKVAFYAMIPWLTEEYGNSSQPYSFSRNPKKALKESREIIASCINALPEEIFFTSGGSESDNWAMKGSVYPDYDKKEIVVSAVEHHAILRSCSYLEKLGCKIRYIKPTSTGVITIEELRKAISIKTALVSVMLANNEIGTIQPIKELCVEAHKNGILFHTDAVQAVGHIKIDVQDLGIDMLSASAHKFNGPKGIGFLYIRKGTNLSPYIDGGSQEFGYRAGTENISSIVGMAVALKENCDKIEENRKTIDTLSKNFLDRIRSLNPVQNGGNNTLPGLLSLSFRGEDGEAILHRMDLMVICISTGAACDSKTTQVSHVLKAIGLSKELAVGTIRVSFGKNNSFDDVERIASCLVKIIQRN